MKAGSVGAQWAACRLPGGLPGGGIYSPVGAAPAQRRHGGSVEGVQLGEPWSLAVTKCRPNCVRIGGVYARVCACAVPEDQESAGTGRDSDSCGEKRCVS